MHSVLRHNAFFVKEHIGMFKAANAYDVLDPESGEELMHCREPNLGMFTKFFRFTKYKGMTPFNVEVTTPSGEKIIRVSKGISFFTSKVDVFDENDNRIGGFKQALFSIGGKFTVLGANDEPLCHLVGKWTTWNFSFQAGDNVLATVSKKWDGLAKELFTSADNYMLTISDQVPAENNSRQLIMAAVICIDMVMKE